MKNLLEYYKFQLNELLLHTMTPTQTIHHITTNIFVLNGGEISDDDFNLYFEGKNMIIELKNNYYNVGGEFNKEKIYSILTTIYSTGYIINQYYLSTNNMIDKMVKSENDFIKQLKTKNIISFRLKCEPKWDKIIKNIPDKIYHITLKENIKNILKYGLNPSSGKKKGYHPERNYFFLCVSDVEKMKNSIHFQNKINIHRLSKKKLEYELLEIDTTNLKSNGFNKKEYDIVFYNDENSDGIYTFELIKPKYIKIINV